MNRVGKFEKVSFGQFSAALAALSNMKLQTEKASELYEALLLPTRATRGSAGYDFRAPFGFSLKPGQTIKFPTGIRVKIDDGWWLGCLPRSGLGFKYRLQLDNTMGVIDSDYYDSDNEGQVFAKITNDSNGGGTVDIKAGDAYMQAIFLPYGITYLDNVDNIRNGGFGSTGN